MSGVNRLPPVGLIPFSVGDGGATLDDGVVVVVVVVVLEGAFPPLLPHAVSAPIPISAPPPITAIVRRINSFELMITTSSPTAMSPQAELRHSYPTRSASTGSSKQTLR